MVLHLPHAIERYIDLENSGNVDALDECFTSNAVVRDEGHTYQGLASIRQWKAEAKRKYNHTVAPLEVVQRDGATILTARLTGSFPGSPVTLEFCFELEHGKIATLEIHP
jgi:hypothetical protein